MYCFYHPERSAVTHCTICAKPLCSECITVKENLSYCIDCGGRPILPSWTRKMIFPALVCGIITGCFSVLSITETPNCAFCLSTVLGGAGAVLLFRYTNNIKGKVNLKKVALMGVMTGFIASAAMWLVSLAFTGSFGSRVRDEAITVVGGSTETILALVFLMIIVSTGILFAVFAVLGGIICNQIVGRME